MALCVKTSDNICYLFIFYVIVGNTKRFLNYCTDFDNFLWLFEPEGATTRFKDSFFIGLINFSVICRGRLVFF